MEVGPFTPTITMVVPELLTENNYKTWKVHMKSYLSSEGLWDIISGEVTPGPGSSGEFRRLNDAALHAIQISCGREAFGAIDATFSAKDAWEILESFAEYGFVDKERPPTFQESELLERSQTVALINAIRRGDFAVVGEILKPDARWGARISKNGYTALHVAISTGPKHIADRLIQEMSREQLEIRDKKKRTALALAAYHGKTKIAERLIEKHRGLLYIKDSEGNIPLQAACLGGHVRMTRVMWKRDRGVLTPTTDADADEKRNCQMNCCAFLQTCIKSKMFDIAWEVLYLHRVVVFENNWALCLSLAEIPSAFFSGSQLVFWQRWIYNCIRVEPTDLEAGETRRRIIRDHPLERLHKAFETAIRKIRKCLILLTDRRKHIYKLKLDHTYAFKILHALCSHLSTLEHGEIGKGGAVRAMFNAIKNGSVEFVIEIIKNNPDIIWMFEESTSRDILMSAIAYRQEEIASFIYGLDEWRDARVNLDKDRNNLLHMAGKLAPDFQLSRLSNAALQMQRELQWFKEVESIVPEYYKECKNDFKKTPGQVFSEEHEDLRRKAEDWMKQTATSYIVAGALIITVMFAAVLTVPGGNNQDTGFPIFSQETFFKMFIISDAVSLSAASISVLMFLGILSYRYAEEDFLVSLPRRLIIGISTLFISIAVMMIAFAAAVAITLNGRLWIIMIISVLSNTPVTFFAFLQFPLLIEIFNSTYQWKVFKKKKKKEC